MEDNVKDPDEGNVKDPDEGNVKNPDEGQGELWLPAPGPGQ